MDYFLILILQFLGIGFHVMQKIISLGDTHPNKTRSDIFSVFLSEDWDSLCVSALVMLTHIVTHYILCNYTDMHETIKYFQLYGFGVALVLGYAGQRIAYKYLGSAEAMLDKKADGLKNKP